jgi:hypothetical protein
MPTIRYRSEVKPHYAGFVADGLRKYTDHRATQAARAIASGLLQGTLDAAAADRNALTLHTEPARAFRMLADHGITADQLLARVAELFCFFEDHPERLPSVRFEDTMVARGVLTLVPWKMRFLPGAKMLRHTGALIRDQLGPWALAFTRKLRQDQAERHALVRRSANFGAP